MVLQDRILNKRQKVEAVTSNNEEASRGTNENPTIPSGVSGGATGISSKLKQLDEVIEELENHITKLRVDCRELRKKIQEKKEEVENRGVVIELMKQQHELYQKSSRLWDKRHKLWDDRESLRSSFYRGLYYAGMSEYWKVAARKATTLGDNHWDAFVRDEALVKNINCRTQNTPAKHYSITQKDALREETEAAASITTKYSASAQKRKQLRDVIWPFDIFGNQARHQEMSQILPCGQYDSIEWIEVSAAAMGLSRSQPLVVKQKAFCGVKGSGGCDRKPNSGLLHFTTNMLRLYRHNYILEGTDPQGMIIPVLSVDQAKKWQGQAYSALFVLGIPKNATGSGQNKDLSSYYHDIHLTSGEVITSNVTRDALPEEVETGRQLLQKAILALGQMSKQCKDDDVDAMFEVKQEDDKRTGVQKEIHRRKVKERMQEISECLYLPEKVTAEDGSNITSNTSNTSKRPICLVSFASADAQDGHPASDPLLLAFQAADIWIRMVNKALLNSGKS
jgi:hypothetical protein